MRKRGDTRPGGAAGPQSRRLRVVACPRTIVSVRAPAGDPRSSQAPVASGPRPIARELVLDQPAERVVDRAQEPEGEEDPRLDRRVPVREGRRRPPVSGGWTSATNGVHLAHVALHEGPDRFGPRSPPREPAPTGCEITSRISPDSRKARCHRRAATRPGRARRRAPVPRAPERASTTRRGTRGRGRACESKWR